MLVNKIKIYQIRNLSSTNVFLPKFLLPKASLIILMLQSTTNVITAARA